MRKMAACAILAVMCALLAAPLAVGEGNVTISGKVLDAKTSAAIAGAKIIAYPNIYLYTEAPGQKMNYTENPSAISAADGSYSISVEPGSYSLAGSADGYEHYYNTVDAYSSTTVDIQLNHLPPYDARLKIVVKDAKTGAGVAKAQVSAYPEIMIEGDFGALGYPSYKAIFGETGADGSFTTGIWNGAYSLSVYAKHYFYNYTRFEVNGADVTVNVPLAPVPSPNATVIGKVVDQKTGLPLKGVTISSYPMYFAMDYYGGYEEVDPVTTDANGKYELKVYAGAVSISAYKDSYYSFWGTVNCPDNYTMSYDIAMFPIIEPDRVAVLKGFVTSEKGAVAGAQVEVTYMPMRYGMAYGQEDTSGYVGGKVDYSVVPPNQDSTVAAPSGRPGAYGEGSWTYNTTTAADGSYKLSVPMGDLSITVFAKNFYPYYGWLYIDSKGTFWQNATLEAIPTPDATIAGIVRDADSGQPIAGAYVSAYMIRDPVETYTDINYGGREDGPGSANASDGGMGSAVAPVTPAGMDMLNPYGYYCAEAKTGADGAFTLAVPHGSHAVGVWAQDHEYYASEVTVEAGQTLTLEISLGQANYDGNMTGAMDAGQYVMSIGSGVKNMPSPGGPESITIAPGETYDLRVGDVFKGGDASGISYSYDATENVDVSYDGATGEIKITAPEGWTGTEEVKLKASDGTTTVYHTMSVKVQNQSPLMAIAGFVGAIALAAAIIAIIWRTQRDK